MSQAGSSLAEAQVACGPGLQHRPAVLELKPQGHATQILDVLPAAIYVTDLEGRITYFNEAAVALWGYRPRLHGDQWCGSWRLYRLDGSPLPHDQCPMAIALKEKRVVRGGEAIAERPDGKRVPFMAFPTPLYDASGEIVGAVNMLLDTGERQRAERVSRRLASIVESSDDAIISKDLNGVIATFNKGAERLFGYSAEEIIGKPVTVLIPAERQDEEIGIWSASVVASALTISRRCVGARTAARSTYR